MSTSGGRRFSALGSISAEASRRTSFFALAAVTLSLSGLLDCNQHEPPHEDRLVVFAAASLREVFGGLGVEFERSYSGVHVAFNFAGTQELRAQLEHGAPVDVFASADQRHMSELLLAKRVTAPAVFARNQPVLVVARESAATVRSLSELPNARRIVIGAAEVPIGRYTLQMLERAAPALGADFRARVEAHVVSRELNVRQVLAKVRLGEADVGVVYGTDANADADGVSVVGIPPEVNVIAEYPIAVVSDAAHPTLARAWVELVLSDAGQRALSRSGFLPAATASKAP